MMPTALALDACIWKQCSHDQQQMQTSKSCPRAVQSSSVSRSGGVDLLLGGEQAGIFLAPHASCSTSDARQHLVHWL